MLDIITGKARTILFIEAVVGVLILLGGIFLVTTKTQAPGFSPSPTPGSLTYISSVLHISLQYPYGWQIDPTFNGIPGIERYQSGEYYFEVGATNDPTLHKGMIIKKYPKPIKLGVTTYRYFVLKADAVHLKTIADSITFL